VEPVYWSSIVIGSLYHRAHMTRAVFGRIKLESDSLPVGYRLSQPVLTPVSQPETRLAQKAASFAVAWLQADSADSDMTEVVVVVVVVVVSPGQKPKSRTLALVHNHLTSQ